MAALFFYGTLCHGPLLDRVLGPERGAVTVQRARLPDHAVYWVTGQGFPMIRAEPGANAEGVLVRGLTAEGVARLNFYEGGFGYGLREVEVRTRQGAELAQVYFPDRPHEPGAPWSLADWVERWGELTVLAAGEVMESYGRLTLDEIGRRFPSIRARAASRLNARRSAPTTLRRHAGPGDVTVCDRRRPYSGFFAVEEYELCHVRFDGSASPVLHRAAFISTDAVTVLPYDPARDRVMVVEQFRMGPFARDDAQCWSLEAIAGRIDPGETPQQTASREAQEEAGLAFDTLHAVHSYYPSPGAMSEYIYSFVGIADLPDAAEGLGGAPDEGEDIRAHVLGWDRLMALMDSGEIENAPLVLSVLWLARHRERLRTGA